MSQVCCVDQESIITVESRQHNLHWNLAIQKKGVQSHLHHTQEQFLTPDSSGSVSLPVTGEKPYNTLLLLISVMFVYCLISQATKTLHLISFHQIQFTFQICTFAKYVWGTGYFSLFYRSGLKDRDELLKFKLLNSMSNMFST